MCIKSSFCYSGFGWGVTGAAAATVLSQYFGPIVLFHNLINNGQLKIADILKPLNLDFVLPFLSRGAVLAARSLFGFGEYNVSIEKKDGIVQIIQYHTHMSCAFMVANKADIHT